MKKRYLPIKPEIEKDSPRGRAFELAARRFSFEAGLPEKDIKDVFAERQHELIHRDSAYQNTRQLRSIFSKAAGTSGTALAGLVGILLWGPIEFETVINLALAAQILAPLTLGAAALSVGIKKLSEDRQLKNIKTITRNSARLEYKGGGGTGPV
jgi:hypothetical protein